MTMRNSSFVLFLMLLTSACVHNPREKDTPTRTFIASSEYGTSTRTTLNGSSVLWSATDNISVFNQTVPQGELYTINAGDAGKTKASFSGNDPGAAPWFALYPADGAASLADGKLSIMLPGVQAYAAASFGVGANPMVAVSSTGTLDFKNLCGILQLQLTGHGTVASITLTSSAQEALWGSAQVAVDYTDVPRLEMTQSVDDQHRTITLDCSDGVELGDDAISFYFVLPAGTLSSGFSIQVSGGDGNSVSRSTATDLSIVRSTIKRMSPVDCSLSAAPLTALSEYGVYDLSAAEPRPIRVFGTGDQLALRSGAQSVFRIQSLVNANALSICFPPDMSEGESYEITLSSVGQTGVEDATVQAVLLQRSGGTCWLENKENKVGYIIAAEL